MYVTSFDLIFKKCSQLYIPTDMYMIIFLIIVAAIGLYLACYLISDQLAPPSVKFIQGPLLRDVFYPEWYDLCHDSDVASILPLITDKDPDDTIHLDVGSGTGRLVHLLSAQGAHSTGIDNSDAFINFANKSSTLAINNNNHINNHNNKSTFVLGSVLMHHWFPTSTFTHITCTHHTLYYFELSDKRRLISNCYYWLCPGGKLVVSVIPDIPTITKLLYEPAKHMTRPNYNYPVEYSSFVDPITRAEETNGPVTFTQKFTDNHTFLRFHEQILFIDPVSQIINLAKSIGFRVTYDKSTPFIVFTKPFD